VSAEAQVARLESLLETIESNRTDAPVRYPDAAARIEVDDDDAPTIAPPPPEAELELDIPAAAAPPSTEREVRRPRNATPMEQAISEELAIEDDEDDEPEISVSYPDDDEPELVIEEPEEDAPAVELEAPTAPVGTRSPEPAGPRTLSLDEAEPSAPVAKVVSRDAPRTFGELLDRALGLRPR